LIRYGYLNQADANALVAEARAADKCCLATTTVSTSSAVARARKCGQRWLTSCAPTRA